MSRTHCRVLIIGCGIGGLATAIGLRNAGHEILVFERMAQFSDVRKHLNARKLSYSHIYVGGGIQIPPNATKCLQHLGVLEAVKANAIQPQAFLLRSYRDSKILSNLTLVPDIEYKYNTPFLTIHRKDLRTILLERAVSLGVEIKLGSQVINVDFGVPSIELSSGKVYEADVVLGGDGDRSISRQALLGHPDTPVHSGDQVISVALNAEAVRQQEDLKSFVDPPTTNVWYGPNAHVVTYMVKRDDYFHMILSRSEEVTEPINSRPQQTDLDELKKYFEVWDPRYRRLLDIAQSAVKWTLIETADPRTWRHSMGRFALIGDAAHAMLPYLAQGAAQLFEDAAVLSALFTKIRCKSQIPDILAIYERVRKPRAIELKERSRAMRHINSILDGPLQEERDRQLLHHAPFEGYPNPLADPVAQKFMFGYDAYREGEDAWDIYLRGEWPGTTGMWKVAI